MRTGFLIHDVARLRDRLFDTNVRSIFGLTSHQWWLLVELTRQDEPLTQTQIAQRLDLGKVPLCRAIDRLETKGFIQRRPHPTDRRSKCVSLSARGKNLTERMRVVALDLGREIAAGLVPQEQRALNELLARMRRNLVELCREGEGQSRSTAIFAVTEPASPPPPVAPRRPVPARRVPARVAARRSE